MLSSLLLVLAVSAATGNDLVEPPNVIPLVGFFNEEDSLEEVAFRVTVEQVNKDKSLLPHVQLVPVVEHVSQYDSFNISRRMCNLTTEGVGGVFGPQSGETARVVSSIARMLEVPHLATHWDYTEVPSHYSINLFPEPTLFAQALVKVIEDMDWKTFSIIYDEEEALVRLQEVMKAYNKLTNEGHVPFTVWQISPEEDQRPLLKEIREAKQNRIVVDCRSQRIPSLLHQAREVQLIGNYESLLLISLDAHTMDYSEYRGLTPRTNMTTVRLVDPLRHSVQAAVQDWVLAEQRNGRHLQLSPDTVPTSAGLIHDAVLLYARALHGLTFNVTTAPLDCGGVLKWNFGLALISYMRILAMEEGCMTGRVEVKSGRRAFFSLEIAELTSQGFRKIGTWDPQRGVSHTRSTSEMEREMSLAISNKTFIVVSRLGEPYLRKVEGEELEGNARYEGFSMDIIDNIAKLLDFNYEFIIAPDNAYGSYNKESRQWNGLIKELRDGRADLAICDLTITYERRSAVDFTMPFMTLGISILFSKAPKQPHNVFSFLNPFSLSVWLYVATAYLGVSLVLYFLSRISPNEWENPHPCNQNSEELECTFSLHNCLWFSIGSLMAQGCDLLPKAISTRTVAGMWWFFVLIMISSYTANLAASLTTERMDLTIENVQDLAKQSKIKYGVMKGGSTASFFRDSNDSMYQKMWSVMESSRPSVFVDSNDDGVERVLKGKFGYAFFMESTSIEYQVEQNCNLKQVGSTLDTKGYGIAMPFQFPYRTAISGAVLKLQETGKLLELKNKWWKEKSRKSTCPGADEPETTSNELGMANVGGVFLVLILGCIAAFIVSIFEFLWNVRKVAREEKISPKEAFMLELRFALQCYGTTKPLRRAESSPDPSQDTFVPSMYDSTSQKQSF